MSTPPLVAAAAASRVWIHLVFSGSSKWAPSDAVLQLCWQTVLFKGSRCRGSCIWQCVRWWWQELLGLQSTLLEFSFPKWAEQDRAGGARGRREAALLVPQDGVLVVELQVLHGSAAGFFPTTTLVFHDLKGLLHFSVPERQDGSSIRTTSTSQANSSSWTLAYLRVSTCLAVDSREGNCASLKISGGPWLGPRLLGVPVSRAPGGL